MIVGQRIHTQDGLEETCVPIVGNLNRHIILVCRVFHLVVYLVFLEVLYQGFRLVGTHPTYHQSEHIASHTLIAQMNLAERNLVLYLYEARLQDFMYVGIDVQ